MSVSSHPHLDLLQQPDFAMHQKALKEDEEYNQKIATVFQHHEVFLCLSCSLQFKTRNDDKNSSVKFLRRPLDLTPIYPISTFIVATLCTRTAF